MYKLFLTFRYLTRKKIVIFPVLVVWLCVMMLIIVTSIMGGFVDRVREANHDLFGDIIISSGSSSQGFSQYDELRAELQKKFPEIEATTPVVEAYALVYVPAASQSRPALLVGVNPEERAKVTRFRESLFVQYKAPMQALEDLSPRLPASRQDLAAFAATNVNKAAGALSKAEDQLTRILSIPPGPPKPNYVWAWGVLALAILTGALIWRAQRRQDTWAYVTAFLISGAGLLVVGAGLFWPMIFPRQFELAEDQVNQVELDLARAERTMDYAEALPDGMYPTRDALQKAIVPAKASFDVPAAAQARQGPDTAPLPPDGCVVGSQLGFFRRDTRGNFLHPVTPGYDKVVINVASGKQETGRLSLNNTLSRQFTIVDDSHTGVYDVDSFNVYASLEMVQVLAGMRPGPDDEEKFDPLCHQILIKLKPGADSEARRLRAAIQSFVDDYQSQNPKMSPRSLQVQTWDEKQARYLGAVENEKTMMTFILGLMSLVVLVVIFLIFYQIVRDKTRDIGIIKAVGGSEEGVAGIFLSYGLFIGVVGGALGAISGILFVTHTNEIHEWIYHATGIIIWDRSVYLFDRIPDVVHSSDVITYFIVAVVAGVLGALIPAVIAGAEDPVQAVRYE